MTLTFSYSPLAAAVLLAFLPQSLFASTIEETVVVADRINTASDALAVSVNVLDRALISALGSATLPQLLESEVGITPLKRVASVPSAVCGYAVKMVLEQRCYSTVWILATPRRLKLVLVWNTSCQIRSTASRYCAGLKGFCGVLTPVG